MTNEDDILSGGLVALPKPPRTSSNYDDIVNRHAQRTGLDPALIKAVIGQESGGHRNAVSPKGARGPMQLMPATAARFGVTNPHDPEQSIRGGSDYLKFLHDRYKGNVDLTLAAYNAGEGAVDKYHGIPPYRETQNYVPAVKARIGAPTRRSNSSDILAGGLVNAPETQTPAPTPTDELSATAAQMNPTAYQPPPSLETPTAPDTAQPAAVQRQVSAEDREWHAAVTPDEYGKLTRKQKRRLDALTAQQIAEDDRKRTAGQSEFTKDVGYQNAVRRAVGLPHVGIDPGFAFNAGRAPIEIKPQPFTFGQDTNAVENQARQTVISRSGGQENIDRIKRDYAAVGRDPATIDQKIAEQVQTEIAKQNTATTRRQADTHSKIADITASFLDAVDTALPLNTNVARGAISGVGETVKQIGRLNQLNPMANVPLVGNLGDVAVNVGRQMEAGGEMQAERSTPTAQTMLNQTFAPGRLKSTFESVLGTKPGASRTLQQAAGRAGVEIPKFMAGGAILKAVELPGAALLPTLGALSGADEGLPGIVKGAGMGLVYHYGGGITGAYIGKVGNSLLWIGAPAAEAHLLNGVPWDKAIAESLPMGAFAGFTGGDRVNVRDASRPEGYRPARLRDIRRIQKDPSLIVPPVDVRVNQNEAPIELHGPNQEPGGRPIVPETKDTIAAQIEAMQRGARGVVVIPPGAKGPSKLPRGYTVTRAEDGGQIIHAVEHGPQVEQAIKDGTLWQYMGHKNADTEPGPKKFVVARSGRDYMANGRLVKAGTELMSSYVNEGNESAAIEEMNRQFAPYKPYMQVGGEPTAEATVQARTAPDPNLAQALKNPNEIGALIEKPQQNASDQSQAEDRFKTLSNRELENYVENAQSQEAKRLARLEARPKKGTPAEVRAALPRRIERQRARMDARITEAQAELARRRAGTDKAPSFEDWIQSESGGAAGGIDPSTLSPTERRELQTRYDEQYYPTPHHSARQRRRLRAPVAEIPDINAAAKTSNAPDLPPAPWEQPTGDKLFATQTAEQVQEPTADEAKAAQEPVIPVRPMERQNALRSYLGNKITMARAGAFDVIPQSWKNKWNRVVDVFGGSGLHGWQRGKALGKPVHYNELDPDVHAFQQLASTNEGQEKLRRVWGSIVDQIGAFRREGDGAAVHAKVNDWWKETQARLSRPDASPEEKATRILLENTLGTMGNTQALMSIDHAWKKDVNALGDISSLLDKHRINAGMWQSTSNKRAEDLLTETKPGDLVTLDPPYASTKGYAVGNDHGTVNGAVNFIQKSVADAVKRGVSIVYTNSAHIEIVEALRKAGLETRIERVQTQTKGGATEKGYRFEVVGWTPDVSPPRGTDPEVLRSLIAQDTRASQRDLSGKTGEELWNTYVRAAKEGEATRATEPTEEISQPLRRGPEKGTIEYGRRAVEYQRKQAIEEAAKILSADEAPRLRGEPVDRERQIQTVIERANAARLEALNLGVGDAVERATVDKEIPAFTRESLKADIDARAKELGTATPEPVQTEARAQDYKPQEGEHVSWMDGDKAKTGKVEKVMPSGRVKVRVDGKTDTRRVTLGADTEFQPHTKEAKTQARAVGRPRLDPTTDSLERAIRAKGGIRDDGSGELAQLKKSGKAGLVTPDGMSPEEMAQALREDGYGVNTFANEQHGSGIDAAKMIEAATEDARGSRKHYSSQAEQDFTKAEEDRWTSQMEPAEREQWQASQKFLNSPRVSRLLQEIADGHATTETYRKLRETGKARGLDAETIARIVATKEPHTTSSSRASGKTEPASEATAGTERRALNDDFIGPDGQPRFAKNPSGWESAEPGAKYPPIFSVTENRVKLENSEASRLLDTAYQQMGMTSRGDSGIGGVYEANPERLIRQLEKMSDEGAGELAKAVRDAAKAGDGKVLMAFGDSAMRHEMFHESSAAANRYLQDRHVDLKAFEGDATFEKIRKALTTEMHYPDNLPSIVEEGAAYIAQGEHVRLGLSDAEAVDYMDKWFKSFAEKNGAVSLKRFREMATLSQQSLERAVRYAEASPVDTTESQRADNRASISADDSGDLTQAKTRSDQRPRSSDIPRDASQSPGSTSKTSNSKSSVLESNANSGIRDAEMLRNLVKSPAFHDHGLRGLDVPSQRIVMSHVLRAIRNFKIREAVVRRVSVDVVNDLIRAKSATDVLLNDKSVLKDVLSIDTKDSITIGIDEASTVVRVIARLAAKLSRTQFVGIANKLSPTEKTGKLDFRHDASPLTESTVSGEPDRKSGSPSILTQEKANEKGAKTAYENARAAEASRERSDADVSGVDAGREKGNREPPTRIRAFRRWFGDSKVVDEKGEPLVVYHGTADDVTAFDFDHPHRKDTGWLGTGVYVTTSPELAGSYTLLKPGDTPNVMSLYAKLENPYRATRQDKFHIQAISHNEGAVAGRAAADAWTAELKAKGYDGVILKYTAEMVGESNAHTEMVVFDPAGVKSATGNRGTYDPDSANILFARKFGESETDWRKRESIAEPKHEEPKTAKTIIPPVTGALSPPTRHVPGERSFPKTAERAGFTGGTDRDYTVLTNKSSLEKADRYIARVGMERAAKQLLQNQEPGSEGMATGILLIQRYEKAGKIGEAVEVANDLARKATKAGQEVQALSIITRLSPEGVLLAAQKRMRGGRVLSEETAKTVVAQAKEITAAEKLVAEIQKQRPDIFGPNGEILPRTTAQNVTRDSNAPPVTRKRARERIGKLQDRLATMEDAARARIAERKAQGGIDPKAGQAGAVVNPIPDIADYAIIGATKLARKGIDRATWLAEMAGEVGLDSKQRADRKALRDLYRQSYAEYEAQRKQFLQESRERGAERQEGRPLDPQERQRIINERADAMTAARKARSDLSRTFRDLNAGRAKKIIRTAGDVWDLSRSAITSADISAGGRQALMALVPHPVTFSRGMFRQFKALSTKQYERIVSENQADPDYKLAVRFKPDFFTSSATTKGGHEEVYQSELAQRIPWIKHSEQMYSTMLDTVRLGWWKSQLKAMQKEGLDPENPDHRPLFELQADLISNFNGRGGGKLVRQVAPLTNKLAFSTRFWASRLRVLSLPLDPRMYGIGSADHPAYSRATRVDAWKTLIGFYGLTASTLAIAKMTGAEVNLTNPDDPDWLKARWGKVHVDFSAGLQSHLRVAARLAKLMYMRERYPERQRYGPMDIAAHYLRSKEAPNVALIHDLFLSDKKKTPEGPKGTNVIGEPVYLTGVPRKGKIERLRTSALAQRAIPIVLQDVMDAYQEGLSKKQAAASIAASVFGESVTTYQPKPRRSTPISMPRRVQTSP